MNEKKNASSAEGPAIPPEPFPVEKVAVFTPIVVDPDDEPDSVIDVSSRLRARRPPGSRPVARRRRVFGFTLPARFADMSLVEIVFHVAASRRGIGSFVSVAIHLAVCILLSLLIFRSQTGSRGEPLDVGFSTSPGELARMVEVEGVSLDSAETLALKLQTSPADTARETASALDPAAIVARDREPIPVDVAQFAPQPTSPAASAPIFTSGGTTKGRTADARKYGLPGREGDTTDKSEGAVENALKWLAAHQLPDGGWSFNLNVKDRAGKSGECGGRCSNTSATSGANSTYRRELHPSRMAATALALLPFLGAGYTHRASDASNPYRQAIYAGLEFLKYGTRTTENGCDFREGILGQGMYIQGIVALTFCEAYEMTGDETLRRYAQDGIRFIEHAQRKDGGWRYHVPEDPAFFSDASGDTTVTGWQIMAIKSALSARLDVHSTTVYNTTHFLDSVQGKDVGLYHYQPRKQESSVDKMWATTAVGLLIRQYLGWKNDRAEMKKGLRHLTDWIEDQDKTYRALGKRRVGKDDAALFRRTSDGKGNLYVYNIYFTYYAALTLHNAGGSDWHRAFKRVRDFLVETQSRTGHENGSWLFYDDYMNDGGRLLNTVLAVLVLETPYRYLPMYR